MYQLKVLLNRSNAVCDPKGNFNSCNDFLQIVIDASFLCAALHFFNMNDLSAPPSINGPSASVLEGSHITRCKYFNNTIANIVDTYVLAQNNDNAEQDGVFNYASSLLSHGLFARCLHDASKEGDGGRMLLYWKFLLLHFREAHATKYAYEAFTLLAQTKALLTPREAHELTWNRTCSKNGNRGSNIELDLHMEHLNRNFKDDLKYISFTYY